MTSGSNGDSSVGLLLLSIQPRFVFMNSSHTQTVQVTVLDRFNITRMFIGVPAEGACLCSPFYVYATLPPFHLLPGSRFIGSSKVGGQFLDHWVTRSGWVQSTVSLTTSAPHLPVHVRLATDPMVFFFC
jgi:hypothetical protein